MQSIPLATYRIQLHSGFTFDDAAHILDYLANLGVTHLYSSPCLQAVQGSTHGYDVVSHTRVNRELGGEEGHERLAQALHRSGMGRVLDIVPNHMAVAGDENEWWWDVLENGRSSRYASYFDVDWDPGETRFGNTILLPILGEHFGRVLENGEIRLERQQADFSIRYFDHVFPVDPRSLAPLITKAGEDIASPELSFLAEALGSLPLPSSTDRQSIRRRHRNKEVIRGFLERILDEHPEAARVLDALIAELNESPDALEALLDSQNYRLAYWRTANQDLGYRRFFDIDSLVGLRTEDEEVFEDTHRLILEWFRQGMIDGMRVDHPDGLRDPAAYLGRLRKAGPESWILVEKILQPGEVLRPDWPVDGTTGYEFIYLLTHLLTDARSRDAFTRFYGEFTGETRDYHEVLWEKKLLVIDELFGSDINRLTALMLTICESHRRYRDYTRQDIAQALRVLIAAFPVYRTYINAGAGWMSDQDRQIITSAVERAKEKAEIDPDLLDFMRDIFMLKVSGPRESEFVMRFQQLTPPVMAKGAEDTAFYTYNRFIAFNEVGGDPGSFGIDAGLFHLRMSERLKSHPFTMLSTSTHDTKRGEDVRARLAVLSEVPGQWSDAVRRWSTRAEHYRKGDLPDRNMEYFLYQTLVGAWPISEDRLLPYLEKASREAKTHTSWTAQDPEYEGALKSFASSLLQDPAFIHDLQSFVGLVAGPGRINSLVQTLLKLTAPGIPDIYQGCELWDLSLVDPDNRRPVDYQLRRDLLGRISGMKPRQIVREMESGLPKLWTINRALELRRRFPRAFGDRSSYRPLEITGPQAQYVVGFIRDEAVSVVVPRLNLKRGNGWDSETRVELPGGVWNNVLSGEEIRSSPIRIGELLEKFPVALMSRDTR